MHGRPSPIVSHGRWGARLAPQNCGPASTIVVVNDEAIELDGVKVKPQNAARGAWGMRLAVAAVLILFGVGLGWGFFGQNSPLHSSAESDPGAAPDHIEPTVLRPPTQLFSLNGLTGLMDQMRQKFGNTMGFELRVFADNADLELPDPKEPRRKLSYAYRGGWTSQSSPSAVSDSDVLVDLGGFDPAAIVGILRGAPKTLNIKQEEVKSTHMSIEASKDPLTPGAVVIEIYVSGEFSSGWLSVDGKGNVVQLHPAS
jgi:hypothetical protein